MASVAEVATAVADVLSDVVGFRADGFVPSSVSPPAAYVSVSEIGEGTYGYGSMEITLDAVVLVSAMMERAGTATLYDYISHTGINSVWTAIADNHTLGLTGTDARVVRYRSLNVAEVAGIGYLGGVFEIHVTTPTA